MPQFRVVVLTKTCNIYICVQYVRLHSATPDAEVFLETGGCERIQIALLLDSLILEVLMKPVAPMIVASCLLLAAAEPPASQKQAESSEEANSRPGAGQIYLEKMVGNWDVSKVFYPRAGDPVRSPGECRQKMIQDGKFLQSEFVFEEGNSKSTGQGVIGFEPESGRFTSFWVDSRQTRMSARRSREPFDGTKIVLYNVVLDPQAKESRRSKTISQLEDQGRKLIHRQYALGSAGEERLTMELIMTRKP